MSVDTPVDDAAFDRKERVLGAVFACGMRFSCSERIRSDRATCSPTSMAVTLKKRDTDQFVGSPSDTAAAAPTLVEDLHVLVQLGLVELLEDCRGELRCEATEFGAAIGGGAPMDDIEEE